MAILKMNKVNLIIFSQDQRKVLEELQNFRDIDFRKMNLEEFDIENLKSKNLDEINNTIFKLESTLKRIRPYEKQKGLIKSLKEGRSTYTYQELSNEVRNSEWEKKATKINELIYAYEQNLKSIENSKNKIKEYTPYEKFDVKSSDIQSLKKVHTYIGVISDKNSGLFDEKINELEFYVENIFSTNKEKTVFIVSKDDISEQLKSCGFSKINIDLTRTPKENIYINEENISKLNEKNTQIVQMLEDYAKNLDDIKLAYEYYSNERLKEVCSENFAKTDKLVVISGYVPSKKIEQFEKKIKSVCKNNYHLEIEEVEIDSLDVPIKLENNILSSPFEDLIKTFSMPKYNEIDPTPVVAPFYWLFFGMMVADLGYGFILSLLTGLVLLTCNITEKMKKNVLFFFYLGFSIMIWGVIYGSVFSYEIPYIPRLINPAVEYNKVLSISIAMGFVHIFLGLGMKGYMLIRDKKPLDAFYDTGLWYITLTTIVIVLGGSKFGFSDKTIQISKYLMYASMLGIVLTGGREAKSVGGRLGLGVYTLYGLSGYLGDFVSYARLMALGLSGSYIAFSVNQISSMVGFKPLTIVFTLLILLIGHVFNILLSLLSAYVHSSRLIYVEFFGKFYEGGGKAFRDFKIDERYINIKEENK